MTEEIEQDAGDWCVCLRSGSRLLEIEASASTAVEAAASVRALVPDALIVAVFAWPLRLPAGASTIAYSDLSSTYKIAKRYAGPSDGPHGFSVVLLNRDGSRSLVPDRAISREEAIDRRDWLLRGYFIERVRYRAKRPLSYEPTPPAVVEFVEVHTESLQNAKPLK